VAHVIFAVIYFNHTQVCNLFFPAGFDVEALSGGSLTSISVVTQTLTQFTSSVIIQVEGELLMFAGTSDGRLLKVTYYRVNVLICIIILITFIAKYLTSHFVTSKDKKDFMHFIF